MMKQAVMVSITALLCGGSAWAQLQVQPAPPTPPVRPATQPAQPGPARLEGEAKLRWVCKQLRLDEKQMPQAEALITAYNAEFDEQKADPAALLMKIQDKYAEVQAAQNAGNTELVKKLQAELKNMAPGALPEEHFFDALQEILTAEQKARVATVRKRADAPGDGVLRPVHVLRAVRQLTLTTEQQGKLEKALDEYRAASQAARTENAEAAAARVDKFVLDVRAILTPPQGEAFDKEIDSLRENPPAAIPAAPTKAPNAPAHPAPPIPPATPGAPAPQPPPPPPAPRSEPPGKG